MMHEVNCELCGSSDKKVLFDRARNNEKVINVIYKQCGLIYINPRQKKNTIKSLYADSKFSIKARGSKKPSAKKFYQCEKIASKRFSLLKKVAEYETINPGHLLEIGCSAGSFLKLMKNDGWNVLGVEPDQHYAQAGKQKYDVEILPEIYEEKVFPDQSFDIIAAFHVLEHVISPRDFLKKAAKEIKPRGLLYLEVPCIERPYGGNLEYFFWSAHLYTFSKNTLLGFLAEAGFQPVHINYVGDFLCIVAQKAKPVLFTRAQYPLDNPHRILENTHRLH